MSQVTLSINGQMVSVKSGTTVFEAARKADIHIPSLCYLKKTNEVGACRVCMVEIDGFKTLQASCITPVRQDMVVNTKTQKVRSSITRTVELILKNHSRDCLTCPGNKKCELQALSETLGLDPIEFEKETSLEKEYDLSPYMVYDPSKCILCGRCISTCKETQKIGILEFQNRGVDMIVGPGYRKTLDKLPCISCGQCINACPVAALREKSHVDQAWQALEDPSKYVIVQTAPAVRAALGEAFNLPIGTRVTGKMVAALRRLGFNNVFDTNFAADLTILEEGHELLHRIKNKGKLPMITSCSPGWIKYIEFNYPDHLDHLSTCKSPHQMMGALLKTYYAEKINVDPKDMYVVSIMPCLAKKGESDRPEMVVDGLRDVDLVLTTRELAHMIKQSGLSFLNLPEESFDPALGEYTGASVIFGASGGVTEAALRTLADLLDKKDHLDFEYTNTRGPEGIKEATVSIGGMNVQVAIAHSTGHAKKLMEEIKAGQSKYHFIEIMACEGGCVNGGGQPKVSSKIRMDMDIRAERAKALYEEDLLMPERKSHKNKTLMKLYEEFLGEPLGHKSHKLLHTSYQAREKYPHNLSD